MLLVQLFFEQLILTSRKEQGRKVSNTEKVDLFPLALKYIRMMARSTANPLKSSYTCLPLLVSLLLLGNAPLVLVSSSRHLSTLRRHNGLRNNRFASRSRSVTDLISMLSMMSSREKITNNHGKVTWSLRGGGEGGGGLVDSTIAEQDKATPTTEAALSSLAGGNEKEDDPHAQVNDKLLAVESNLKAIKDNATGVTFQPKLGDGLYLIGAGSRTKTFVRLYAVAIYGSPSVLNAISSFQPGEEQRREAAVALRNAARTFASDSFSPTTSLVLHMIHRADAKTVAKAIADSVKVRYSGSLSDIKELESLISKGIMKIGGQATKGTVLQFDCSEDGVSVSVDGALQGLTSSKDMMASAFVDVYLDEKAVSPTLVDSCLDWRGKDASELSASLLEQHENVMKSTGRPREDPRLRLKSDPSSIPLNSLLSNHYLMVPNTDKGKTLLGLTQRERHNRLKFIYGPNELEQPPERSLMSYIIEQFDDKLVRILLVVALVSGLFGLLELKDEMGEWASRLLRMILQVFHLREEANSSSPPLESIKIAEQVLTEAKSAIIGASAEATIEARHFSIGHIIEALVEPIVISTILVINALVGGYQSLNASKGISALKQMQAQKAVVKINGDGDNLSTAAVEEVEVESSSLVPGDVVVLSVGQKIPADIRLVSVSTSTFTVDEACLTGESDSVMKMPYKGDSSSANSQKGVGVGAMGAHANGMLYSGTVITAGKGVGVVVRTGMDTEMGKVSLLLIFDELFLFCFIHFTKRYLAACLLPDSTRSD